MNLHLAHTLFQSTGDDFGGVVSDDSKQIRVAVNDVDVTFGQTDSYVAGWPTSVRVSDSSRA